MKLRFISLAILLALLPFATALAHGTHSGGAQTFTQSVGPYELAVTLENTITPTPAPLYLTVSPQEPLGDAVVELRAAPRGQPLTGPPLDVGGVPDPLGRFYAEVQLDRGGDWELEVRAHGSKGSGVARIPFTIAPPVLPAYTVPLLLALGGLVALLSFAVIVSVVFGRLKRPTPRWANLLVGQGLFACVLVAAIFGWQQLADSFNPAQQTAAAATTGGAGRPHATMIMSTEPARPAAGQPLTLTLELSDGSTGLPADDLVPHHEALIHLVVIDDGGAFFRHLHPARVAPGRFTIALTPDRPGHFTAYAEIARVDSGSQLLSQPFEVAGGPALGAPPASGLGTQSLGAGTDVTATANGPLRAGRQATLTFSFRQGGAPLRDLRLWLGMPGHLIARRSDGALFSHVHAAEVVPSDLTVDPGTLRYGPDIRFAYTFPQPGTYQVWAQVRDGDRLLTVPLSLEVSP